MSDQVKEFHPLAVNIKKLNLNYSDFFDLPEIVLFEWFIVKDKVWRKRGYKEFYSSTRQICAETKIGKAQVRTIIEKFKKLGFITAAPKKRKNNTTFFTVDLHAIIRQLPRIYNTAENFRLSENGEPDEEDVRFSELSDLRQHLPENGQLLSFFGKLLPENGEQKNKKKNIKQERLKEKLGNGNDQTRWLIPPMPITGEDNSNGNNKPLEAQNKKTETGGTAAQQKNDTQTEEEMRPAQAEADRQARGEAKAEADQLEKTVVTLKRQLNKLYAERVKRHNNEVKSGKKEGRQKAGRSLPFSNKHDEPLYELYQEVGWEDLENSFIAYIDDILEGERRVGKTISYFLATNEAEGFSTFLTYLDKFNNEYSYD